MPVRFRNKIQTYKIKPEIKYKEIKKGLSTDTYKIGNKIDTIIES